jgi:uncharacterized protein YndB with AHSA1/START domain
MSVKEEDGRRSVQVEVEVPGTVEEVWEAIATGRGVSSWFCKTDVEERAGGAISMDMGGGMMPISTVKTWDPPHMMEAEGPGWQEGAPPIATQWTVEARSGGTCIVRVVHSMFTSSADWDDQIESTESGWPSFFGMLRLYLENFKGQPCTSLWLMGATDESVEETWAKLTEEFGLTGVDAGQKWTVPAGDTPQFSGVVEQPESGGGPRALMQLETPGPGVASVGVSIMGGRTSIAMAINLYGDQAADILARDGASWQKWMSERFSAPSACA